ncbi:MAG: nucleotidyltransferase domain-containing protein [bacterium]
MMEREVKEIADKIAAGIKPIKIILFGSRAVGKAGPDSDIDLCVIKDRVDDKGAELVRIHQAIRDVNVPTDILLFVPKDFEKRKDIWGTVQYEIDKKGVVVYERGN